MKSFVVSAIAGAAIIGMHGVTAILGAKAGTIPAMEASSLIERQDKIIIADGGCWETSTGEVRCRPATKDKREDLEERQDKIIIADGGCWETSTGEVRCRPATKGKRQDKIIIADGGCWETSTGEVRCRPAGKDKRADSNETATAAAPATKRDGSTGSVLMTGLSHGINTRTLLHAKMVVAASQSLEGPGANQAVHGETVAPHTAGAGIPQTTAVPDV
ncbi:MAG: hypothetical protein Q9221_005528 [Calogaya cf. arnoldii]